ncbi:calcium-activated chloride channel-domain-containing protein [Obelidium mucronatum]|nr:calcium-activated chloride channel-domain-containing protein [Obelidium mucronatum]
MKLKLPLKTDTNYNSRLSVSSAGAKTIPSYLNGSIRYLKRLFMLDDLDTKTQSAAFKRKDLTRFKGGDPKDIDPCTIQLEFFRDSHRSLLTFNIISHVEISMQVAGLVAKHKDRKGIDYLLSEGIYTAMFHLHDNENDPDTMREYLRREWVQKYFEIQPIDDIAAYFGETVGLYFAFIGFYNVWLLISTGLGLIVVLHGLTQAFTSDGGFQWHILFDNDLTPFFGLFISLWAILMPIAWDRQTKFFAWRWSTTDYQKEETKRPQYKGELQRRSPITGKMELVFPAKRRTRRQLISSVVILFWILIVSSSIAVQVSIGAYLSPKVNNDIAINVITSLLGLTSIVIMKIPFGAIVEKLNEWENYRTKSQFDDALIFKTYIFDFANSYSQLIYYAFVKPNLSYYYLFGMEELNEYCTKEQCASSVTINLFVIFIGGQIIERFQELAIPLIVAKSKQMLSVFRLKSRRSKMMRKKTIRPEETTQSNDTIILASVVGKSEHSLAPSATSTIDHKTSPITFQYPPPRSRKATLAIAPTDTPSIRLEAPEITHSMTTANSLPAFQSVEQLNTHLNPSHAGSRNVSIILEKTEKSKSRTGSIMSQSSALANIRNSTAVPRSSVMLPLASHRPSMSTYDDQYVIDLAEAELLPQYYRDDKLNAFGGIRDEYATKIIQFGYIALFACSFPLAPLFALINNIYEIRADAFKLLVVYQRPEPFLAQDIGVWGMIIRVIAITSVATNSVLVSFTSPTFDTFFIKGLSMGEQMAIRLGFVIVFHYIVFALTQVFQLLMPNTPSIVTTAMARAQYLEKVKMDQDLEEEDEFFNQESRDSLC